MQLPRDEIDCLPVTEPLELNRRLATLDADHANALSWEALRAELA